MKGIFTVDRKSGTAVYFQYVARNGQRVRERFALVEQGLGFGKRLAQAQRRAEKELISRKAAVNEGRPDRLIRLRPRRCPRTGPHRVSVSPRPSPGSSRPGHWWL